MRFVRAVATVGALALVPLAVASCSSEPTPCEVAFKAAADVAPGQTNDAEMIETLKVCSSQEWSKTLRHYPAAIGLQDVTDRDEIATWKTLCPRVPEGQSVLCDGAREAGVLP